MADLTGLPPLEKTETTSNPGKIDFDIDFGGGPSTKEIMVGAGSLLILTIIFFLIRNAYVNYLVSSLKRSPNNAGLAGWGLFGALLFGSAIGGIGLVGQSFLTVPYIAPLAGLSLVCLILCVVVSLKK